VTKRFIELVNGQPVRNTRNVLRSTNRVELEFYKVSTGKIIQTNGRAFGAFFGSSGTLL